MPEYLVTVGVRAGDARPVIVSILHNESYTAQARRYPLALPAWRGRHLGSIVDPARTTVTEPRPNTLTCRFSAHGGANLPLTRGIERGGVRRLWTVKTASGTGAEQ